MGLIAVVFMLALSVGARAADPADTKVTDQAYVAWGHDPGYTDKVLANCTFDKRQQNEPTIAQNPRHPNIVAAGSNDYCTVPTAGDAWAGFYISMDHGQTWTNSLLPGYPGDMSTAGRASPIQAMGLGNGGDPIMDWDNLGNLFYGGISFNRARPALGSLWVATYADDGSTYRGTRIVNPGTPSPLFLGIFNDKPTLKVDQWPGSPFENRLYVAWAIFNANGVNRVFVSYSADHGASFSIPTKVSESVLGSQGTDIAVGPDGSVYVFWRMFAANVPGQINSVVFAKSRDGGVSWTKPAIAQAISPADRSDVYVSGGRARDCGDGPNECRGNYSFFRMNSYPAAAVDATGNVYIVWAELFNRHATGTTYSPGGQAQVVVSKSADGGRTWSDPAKIDSQARGHQIWPDLAYGGGALYAVYYDSRNDPAYSEDRPVGNNADGTSSGPSLDTFASVSMDGGMTWTHLRLSEVSHAPNYEMFGNRQVPFHGDYIWVTTTLDGHHAHAAWTDNRDVVPGTDPREEFQDGFDVLQCRDPPTNVTDTCPNAGGLNQNIYQAIVAA